jgi:hypothetical protein
MEARVFWQRMVRLIYFGLAGGPIVTTNRSTELDLTKEEFLALRREVEAQVAETRRIELAAIGGVAAIYAWLATHSPIYGIEEWAWLLPILLPLFGGFRSRAIGYRIDDIREYLQKIEKEIPKDRNLVGGWETFLAQPSRRKYIAKSAWAYWIILLVICFVISGGGIIGQCRQAPPVPRTYRVDCQFRAGGISCSASTPQASQGTPRKTGS